MGGGWGGGRGRGVQEAEEEVVEAEEEEAVEEEEEEEEKLVVHLEKSHRAGTLVYFVAREEVECFSQSCLGLLYLLAGWLASDMKNFSYVD